MVALLPFHVEPDLMEEYLTTSEAAKLCKVTRFTIRNWILEDKLKAFSTAGHHHRILKSNLLKFMEEHGIRPAESSQKTDKFLHCWENEKFKNQKDHECGQCLVFKEKAKRCFLVVRKFGQESVRCKYDCAACEYMRSYFKQEYKILASQQKENVTAVRKSGRVSKEESQDGEGGLAAGLFMSGKYVAILKHVFEGKNKKGTLKAG